MNIQPTTVFGIFVLKDGKKFRFATQNLTPGIPLGKEQLITVEGKEYRIIDPKVSKLGAALRNGIHQMPIKPTDVLLYLGASSGTTASYFSDILGKTGFIFAVEVAPAMCRELVFLAQSRPNIAPLLADAAQAQTYANSICQVDIVYQDVSQRNQVEIFLNNCQLFLKKDGIAVLCLKARSIDVRKKPEEVYLQAAKQLQSQLLIIDKKSLDPFQKDHMFFVCKKK